MKAALQWLKTNNFLYSSYLANYETIPGHFKQKSTNCTFPGIPNRTSDISFKGTGQLSEKYIEQCCGLIIPSDN